MVTCSRVVRPALIIYTRRFSRTALLRDTRSLMKLKKLQADYQCEDGRPIFLKAGLRDRILYSLTLLLCVVGVLNVLVIIYGHAKPSSWKVDSEIC